MVIVAKIQASEASKGRQLIGHCTQPSKTQVEAAEALPERQQMLPAGRKFVEAQVECMELCQGRERRRHSCQAATQLLAAEVAQGQQVLPPPLELGFPVWSQAQVGQCCQLAQFLTGGVWAR